MWLRQPGELRLGPDRPWLPFTADETIDSVELGLRWVAAVHMYVTRELTHGPYAWWRGEIVEAKVRQSVSHKWGRSRTDVPVL
jgi:hypothetical protein